MQAVGKKNRTSLHSLYDFVLMTRGILCIGTGGPITRERGDYFASEFTSRLSNAIISIFRKGVKRISSEHFEHAGNLLRGTARLFLRHRFLETTNLPGRKHAFLPPLMAQVRIFRGLLRHHKKISF